MTEQEFQAFRAMKLASCGLGMSCAPPNTWAVRLNVRVEDIRAWSVVPGSQALLVFVPCGYQ